MGTDGTRAPTPPSQSHNHGTAARPETGEIHGSRLTIIPARTVGDLNDPASENVEWAEPGTKHQANTFFHRQAPGSRLCVDLELFHQIL